MTEVLHAEFHPEVLVPEAQEIHAIALAERKQKRNTLYEVESELQALQNSEEDYDWEAFQVALAEQLPRNTRKAQDVGTFVLSEEALVANMKAEKARLDEAIRFHQNIIDRTRASILYVFKALFTRDEKGKWRRLRGHTLTLGLRNNPERVKILDEEQLPPRYKRYKIMIWGDTWAEILQSIPADLKHRVVEEINQRKIECEVSKTRIEKAITEQDLEVPGADMEYTESVVIK